MTTFAAARIGFRAARQAKVNSRTNAIAFPRLKAFGARIANSIFMIAGLGVLDVAGWIWNPLVGLVGIAISLFVLDFELSD